MVPPSAMESGGSSAMASRMRVVTSDRKSTRLNSSHLVISYAVFCFGKNPCSNLGHVVSDLRDFQLRGHLVADARQFAILFEGLDPVAHIVVGQGCPPFL